MDSAQEDVENNFPDDLDIISENFIDYKIEQDSKAPKEMEPESVFPFYPLNVTSSAHLPNSK